MITQKHINLLTKEIIGCAIEVHKEFGPGMLEKTYEKALIMLLSEKGLKVQSQVEVPVLFKGKVIDNAFRLDLLVENLIIVELKAVENILPVHEAQLLTYLKLTKKPKGILINFNVVNLYRDGQKTFVNDLFRNIPEE